MKGKNIEKIAEKMKAIGKVKVEKDEEGNEHIIFDSELLPCAQEVRAGLLERDLFYIRDLMVMKAGEEADAFADDPHLRGKWFEAIHNIVRLQEKWESIIPDIYVNIVLREGGNGDMYAIHLRTAGYEEDEIRQIWHDSGMHLNVFLDRLKDLGCEMEAEKLNWNFLD